MWQCVRCERLNDNCIDFCVVCICNGHPVIRTLVQSICSDNGYEQLINRLNRAESRGKTLTPQEELFSSFFNAEKAFVKDMDILTLRAHREELAKIAFEARARLTAVDDEDKVRKGSNKENRGFSTSLQTDEITTNAINTIRARKDKMSKQEKLVENIMKLGIDRKTAEQMVSAGALKASLDSKFGSSSKPIAENKPISNPFAKTSEPETKSEISIQEETNTVIIREAKIEVEKTEFVNPFTKK